MYLSRRRKIAILLIPIFKCGSVVFYPTANCSQSYDCKSIPYKYICFLNHEYGVI